MTAHPTVMKRGADCAEQIQRSIEHARNLGLPVPSAFYLMGADWTAFICYVSHYTGREVEASTYRHPVLFDGVLVKFAALADTVHTHERMRDIYNEFRKARSWGRE